MNIRTAGTLSFLCALLAPLQCTNLGLASTATAALAVENPPTRELTRVYLARVGIFPESACAAGLTIEQVTLLFQTASDTLETLTPSIEASDLAVSGARAELALLRGRAASLLDPALEPVIHQAEATLAAATAAQTLLWQSAFETTISPLDGSQKTLLRALRTNAQVEVPTEYKVVLRPSDEWTDLKKALLHVKSRESCNLAPSADRAALVSAAAADAAVYAAKQRLTVGLAAMRTAWNPVEQP